jgi:hypothetical protein
VALLAAEALDLGHGHALRCRLADSASFTSSSLKGLMMAVMSFMEVGSKRAFVGVEGWWSGWSEASSGRAEPAVGGAGRSRCGWFSA